MPIQNNTQVVKSVESLFRLNLFYLDDNSSVYDLVAVDEDGGVVVLWNTPSHMAAANTKEALTKLLQRFKDCGSDLETCSLINSFDGWIKAHSK